MKPLRLFEIARDDALEFIDGVGLVGTVIDHRAFNTRASPGPGLAFLIAWQNEHREFAVRMAGRKNRHRLGLDESGEVIKVAVLAINEIDVVGAYRCRRARKDRD